MSNKEQDEQDQQIEIFKVKKLIKNLQAARGNGTSMISLIIPPGDQISRVNKMLSDEYGTASNIKSRVNRLSVLSAITSTQQRLKLYNRCPKNGLVIYCGTVITEDGKERKVNIDFEPFKPINTSLYLCDNKFHTENLNDLSWTTKLLALSSWMKHGRGGQSALRFARLRLEKRHNYVRKVAELATQLFVPDGQKPNVQGIVLAGSADFKTELMRSDLFDPRLCKIVVKMIDVSYGGENGFNQAIEMSADALANVKLMKEKKLLQKYMDEISQDTGKYCFMVEDTLKALELGAVEDLIVWDNLDVNRYVLRNQSTSEETILHLTKEQESQDSYFRDATSGTELETVEKEPFVEWLANNYKNFGCNLEFVTDRSSEGTQFVKGFGGIGGILRWKVDFVELGHFEEAAALDHAADDDDDDDNEKMMMTMDSMMVTLPFNRGSAFFFHGCSLLGIPSAHVRKSRLDRWVVRASKQEEQHAKAAERRKRAMEYTLADSIQFNSILEVDMAKCHYHVPFSPPPPMSKLGY
ncbi:Eukaryotic peptide chain release factor subunit 1 [Seminavis robusta]|uniref:Eukaryotic peptide chain release factor subunit 1 n=1 Tax=Seminavis robusta TaxID=568900 RepID=A0A9N8E037_9STRA|nr:Eukaryotic peptide chain release factor subunit 1 [Seminavis robusta]|eukprot:Sro513_g157910.1 Eukaryotic peptide chain release factor subunit 1 (525) ;mRNA; f:50392-52191